MKKMTTAILLFDLMAGLLFLGLHELHERNVAANSGMVRIIEETENLEAEDVKKIAITFDGESIIRLSQENCLKEAVSMI